MKNCKCHHEAQHNHLVDHCKSGCRCFDKEESPRVHVSIDCCVVVDLEAVPTLPLATSIIVEPADADDWELVELHADHMEEQILNQVSCYVLLPLLSKLMLTVLKCC